MCILLCLGDVQLRLAVVGQVFAQCVLYVLLVEENVHACERSVVRRHAVVLQTRDGVHALLRHILLGQYDSQLFSAVVAVVEEDHYIAFLDGAVESATLHRLP